MRVLLKHEWKQIFRSLLIWSLAVGAMGMLCICLYASMTEDMAELSESFSNMGAFSDAFGMSTLGIGTIAGYFATEVGVVHSLGSSMFAAIMASTILSKEEEGHTCKASGYDNRTCYVYGGCGGVLYCGVPGD